MLNKLLKYDIRSAYKSLIVFYIITIISAIIAKIFKNIDNSTIMNIIGGILVLITIVLIISIMINNIIRLWMEFVKNIYGDESYLTHTLPVTKDKIYLSKVISGLISLFTSILVVAISLVICFYSKDTIEFIKINFLNVESAYEIKIVFFLILMFLIFFLEIAFLMVTGYMGIILGHRSNNSKIVKSVVFGIVAYYISQVVTLVFVLIIAFFNNEIMTLLKTNTQLTSGGMKILLIFSLIIYSIYTVIYYYIGKIFLNKGVNVD